METGRATVTAAEYLTRKSTWNDVHEVEKKTS